VNASASNPNTIGWHFRHVYFLDGMTKHGGVALHDHGEEAMTEILANIPEHLHMLNHIYRSANHAAGASQTKSFIDPEKASIVFSHWPTASLNGTNLNHEVSLSVGQLHHYRRNCDPEVYRDCEGQFLRDTVRDTSVWKWKDEVTRKSLNVLNELGLI